MEIFKPSILVFEPENKLDNPEDGCNNAGRKDDAYGWLSRFEICEYFLDAPLRWHVWAFSEAKRHMKQALFAHSGAGIVFFNRRYKSNGILGLKRCQSFEIFLG